MKNRITYVTDKNTNLTKRVIKHGGKRKGSGRKPGEPTSTIRVPEKLKQEIKEFIKKKRDGKKSS